MGVASVPAHRGARSTICPATTRSDGGGRITQGFPGGFVIPRTGRWITQRAHLTVHRMNASSNLLGLVGSGHHAEVPIGNLSLGALWLFPMLNWTIRVVCRPPGSHLSYSFALDTIQYCTSRAGPKRSDTCVYKVPNQRVFGIYFVTIDNTSHIMMSGVHFVGRRSRESV